MSKVNSTLVESYLRTQFDAKHVTAAVKHFHDMTAEFRLGKWEAAIGKGGKFIEAVLKALYKHVGKTLPASAREFKAGKVMTDLEQLPSATHDDAVRLTIPRACRFAYDIASNRGARHDPGEIDPNEMDARVVLASCSWVLAELTRYSQKNAVSDGQLEAVIDSITSREYPLIESIDGRVYFHVAGASARDIALLTLWKHPRAALDDAELLKAVKRHGFSKHNSEVAISRIRSFLDRNDYGRISLLAPGLQKAEELIAAASKGNAKRKKRRKRRKPSGTGGTAPDIVLA